MVEVLLTEAGKKIKEERLNFLKTVERQNVAEEIKIARGFGDLSENAEYDAARNRQREIEKEIAELEAELRFATIIKESRVTLQDLESGKPAVTYILVGSAEANINENKISMESPIGKAVVNAKKGDTIEVELKNGRTKKYKVLSYIK